MRLIDIEPLQKERWHLHRYVAGVYAARVEEMELEKVPTVDAAPVKHGRWEGNETCDAYDIVGVKTWAVKRKCSVCGFVHKFIESHMCYKFCPNCGARMNLEET